MLALRRLIPYVRAVMGFGAALFWLLIVLWPVFDD